jgi:stearoyl-CoA desaturase (delta-9 desaturase)
MLQSSTVPLAPASPPTDGQGREALRPPLLEQVIGAGVLIVPALATALAIVLMCLDGISRVSALMLIVMYTLTGFGICIGYHRLGTHNSFKTLPVIRAFFGVLGSMAAQGPMFYWIAIHRRHHATADHEGDPHSPNAYGKGLSGLLRGLWHAHIGWFFEMHANMLGVLSTKLALEHEDTNQERYIPDLIRDPWLVWVNRLYFLWVALGLALPAAGAWLLTGTWSGTLLGLLWGGMVRMFLVTQATASIASLSHVFGSRPYQTRDGSRNSFISAVITFGEGWHNNHHAFPTSAWHGLRWWEIDMTGWLITAMKLVGLAWDVKVPTRRAMEAARRAEQAIPVVEASPASLP